MDSRTLSAAAKPQADRVAMNGRPVPRWANRTLLWVACGAVLVVMAALAAGFFYAQSRDEVGLRALMATLVPVGSAQRQSCRALAAGNPLVILALGQSNAGNHGAMDGPRSEPITMVVQGQCVTAQEPLPGATGLGASIWGRLSTRLSSPAPDGGLGGRPVVMAVLAVDSSSIAQWTRQGGALRERLAQELELMKQSGLPPSLILWQQGEADARTQQSSDDYGSKLDALADLLTQSGVAAPVMLAHSTICRSAPSNAIRSAIDAKVAQGGRWLAGPDTDTLSAPQYRHDGCHFSTRGLNAAAQLWGKAILQAGVRATGE